jgi:hypothetical protein
LQTCVTILPATQQREGDVAELEAAYADRLVMPAQSTISKNRSSDADDPPRRQSC